MKLTTVRCDQCGIVCTNQSYDYNTLDLCQPCMIARKEKDSKSHTANFAGDAGNDPVFLSHYGVRE